MKNTPVLAIAFFIMVASLSAAPADSSSSSSAAASASDKAAKPLLDAKFVKETSGDNKGLYTLALKNISAKPVKVTVAIEESVRSHARPNNRTLPAQTIEPGKTWKVEALAAQDKVIVSADGVAPLNLTVP